MDGSEIHEAVITMLAIDRAGAEPVCMAPNVDQMHVVNHLSGEPVEGQTRNVLEEAARIARGNIRDLAHVKAADIDALALPGGYGAAKNLCTYAVDGPDCQVDPEVARLLREVHEAGKPILAVCIAPVILAKVLGRAVAPKITIGTDAGTADHIQQMGAQHLDCPVSEFKVDEEKKIVTSPAYMLAKSISEAAEGIEKAVEALVRMA
jgi:enhancing lycopene biosynthesis protein 2